MVPLLQCQEISYLATVCTPTTNPNFSICMSKSAYSSQFLPLNMVPYLTLVHVVYNKPNTSLSGGILTVHPSNAPMKSPLRSSSLALKPSKFISEETLSHFSGQTQACSHRYRAPSLSCSAQTSSMPPSHPKTLQPPPTPTT